MGRGGDIHAHGFTRSRRAPFGPLNHERNLPKRPSWAPTIILHFLPAADLPPVDRLCLLLARLARLRHSHCPGHSHRPGPAVHRLPEEPSYVYVAHLAETAKRNAFTPPSLCRIKHHIVAHRHRCRRCGTIIAIDDDAHGINTRCCTAGCSVLRPCLARVGYWAPSRPEGVAAAKRRAGHRTLRVFRDAAVPPIQIARRPHPPYTGVGVGLSKRRG